MNPSSSVSDPSNCTSSTTTTTTTSTTSTTATTTSPNKVAVVLPHNIQLASHNSLPDHMNQLIHDPSVPILADEDADLIGDQIADSLFSFLDTKDGMKDFILQMAEESGSIPREIYDLAIAEGIKLPSDIPISEETIPDSFSNS